jgi:hypothetical protein
MSDSSEGTLHEWISKLACEYWERRGSPFGSPEIDWSAAEKAVASSRGHVEREFSLYSLAPEPDTTLHRQ